MPCRPCSGARSPRSAWRSPWLGCSAARLSPVCTPWLWPFPRWPLWWPVSYAPGQARPQLLRTVHNATLCPLYLLALPCGVLLAARPTYPPACTIVSSSPAKYTWESLAPSQPLADAAPPAPSCLIGSWPGHLSLGRSP
jgi:hypothetical protein